MTNQNEYRVEYATPEPIISEPFGTDRKAAEARARYLSGKLHEVVYVLFIRKGCTSGHRSFYEGRIDETAGAYA